MPWQIFMILLAMFASFAGSYAVKPLVVGRIIRTVFLLCLAAICGFGFLASFEFPGITVWKIMYSLVCVAALTGALLPWLIQPSAPRS